MKVPPKKPHFFKPIVPGFKNGLKIPTGFLKYLKGHEHERAILRRGCKKWLVKLNGQQLEEGWEKFADEHDLHLGDILVFRHEGDMEFDVSIFDSSQCNRKYEAHTVEETFKNFEYKEKRRPKDIKLSKKDSFHAKAATNYRKPLGQSRCVCTVRKYCLSRGHLADLGRMKGYQLIPLRPEITLYNENSGSATGYTLFQYLPKQFAIANGLTNKKCNLILKDEGQRSWNLKLSYCKTVAYIGDGWSKFVVDNCLKKGDRIMFEIVTSGGTPIWKFQVVANGETPMSKFQGTRDFIRKKHAASGEDDLPYFISTIKPYCIKDSVLYLPLDFAKSNGLINRKCEMILKDEAQRPWSVWIGRVSGRHFGIRRGWSKFRAANGLQVGDAYKFELIKNGKIPEAYFHHLRGSPSLQPEGKKKDFDVKRISNKGLDSQEKPESNIKTSGKVFPNVEASKDMHLSHPHFICTIQPSCISRHYLRVPRQFALEICLNNRKCEIIVRDERRSWTCKLYSSGRRTYIGRGWREFSIANCLKEEDRLMFEMVSNGEKPVLRLYDLRGPSLKPEVKKKNLDSERISYKGKQSITR